MKETGRTPVKVSYQKGSLDLEKKNMRGKPPIL